ncbi:copper amine oxidase N-terminal domain-containing protein [Acidaminobacter sp.]|uniref:copper amine oxidase N-terminal domain-containing protein n=1 Tax=Acidaminobacter sp. TaxID=1872102 RepID=UPI00138161C1|nr:copper amine oxidase N-terminal domain-containing protein [Acidaminobacter sp.]MDK9709889.1 copper amine oxidase N-terminal domain-containing protein [Acidaminobacter sp.]MZQ97472.1 hypothetical protein [Acidaminobacter sp.]
MKRNRNKGLVLFLMLVLILTMSIMPSAAAKPEKEVKVKPVVTEQIKPEKVVRDAAWEAAKDAAETEKDRLEVAKDLIEAEIERQMSLGNQEEAALLADDFAAAKASFIAAKAELKSVIKNGYTEEELTTIDAIGVALVQADPTIQVLPVENIIVKGKHLGFDTPPVIKAGRTLVPVRALVQAFGAEVTWNPVNQTVTITRGDQKIVLTLGETEVVVDDNTIQLDVPAQTMNGRTVVPLRFIAEQMGFEVDYEDGDVTIEEGVVQSADETEEAEDALEEETESTETESTETEE